MRIAFYAPLKPPDHPVPSGDRRMARLLMAALRHAGHQVDLVSRLRSRDGSGDPLRQARIERAGAATADRLLRRFRAQAIAERPRAWLTYHLYYKAPDWIGPAVSAGLDIPYLAVEASLADKRASGPWAAGHRAAAAAVAHAAAIIAVNPADVAGLPDTTRLYQLPPFLAAAPYRAAAKRREGARAELAAELGIVTGQPWLLAVAMMRPGDKLASYRLLGDALARIAGAEWQLLIAGDGPARADVEAAFSWAPPGRVRFLGAWPAARLPALYAACDLLLWPAINEAYGMALLEAQAAGLPVVAGDSGGVANIVTDGQTGVLVPPGNAAAFAAAVARLLPPAAPRRAMAAAAMAAVASRHEIVQAAQRLDAILRQVVGP